MTVAVDAVEQISPWGNFGLGGMVIGVLFWFIFKLLDSHRSERIEWRDAILEQNKMFDSRLKESNEINRGLLQQLERMNNRVRETDLEQLQLRLAKTAEYKRDGD